MADMGMPGGYFEDDEPVEDVISAYELGEHGVTRPPVLIDTAGLAAPAAGTTTYQARISVRPAAIRPIRPISVREAV